MSEKKEIIEVTQWWFENQKFWFGCSHQDDVFLSDKYYKLFLKTSSIHIREDTPKTILGKIIIFDQFTRHFLRLNLVTKEDVEKYNKVLCEYITFFIRTKKVIFEDPHERCFFILPLRHSSNIKHIKLCLEMVKSYLKEENSSVYNNFFFHTLKKYVSFNNPFLAQKHIQNSIISDFMIYYSIVDKTQKSLGWSFRNNIYSYNSLEIIKTSSYETIKEFIVSNKIKDAIVSLSGGVDSMLILVCLDYIYKNTSLLNSLSAVHIQHNNKPLKSYLECEFVKRWCIHNKINIYIRNITEITRASEEISREFYEDITKEIRFNSYKYVSPPNTIPNVFLGHNKNDCIENLLCNIKKEKSYENLYGMEEITQMKKTNIMRPLLKVSKKEIFDACLKANFCHTKNCTPINCERGKIRKDYENFESFIKGFENIQNILKDSFKIIKIQSDSILNKTIIENGTIFRISFLKEKDFEIPLLNETWGSALRKIFNEEDMIISKKSVKNFLFLVTNFLKAQQNNNVSQRKFILTKKLIGEIILCDSSSSPNKLFCISIIKKENDQRT